MLTNPRIALLYIHTVLCSWAGLRFKIFNPQSKIRDFTGGCRKMTSHKFLVPALLLFFCLAGICLHFSPSHAGINEWTAIGPEGGKVYDLVIHPKDPNILFAAFKGGLFNSTDGGVKWHRVETELTGIETLATDPLNANVLYAIVHHRSIAGPGWYSGHPDLYGLGGTLFKSKDGGANWSELSAISDVKSLAISPIDTNVIYAATYYGVFKSTDSGESWNHPNFGNFPASTLVIDPKTPNIIYASKWSEFGLNNSLLKSIDGGAGWRQLSNTAISTMAINPASPEIIYAAAGTSLLKTTDGGLSWNATGYDQMTPIATIAIDPLDPNVIYIGTGDYWSGLFKSTDGGNNWTSQVTGLLPQASVTDLVINPVNPNIIYAGTDKGLFKSIDAGANWNPIYANLPMTDVSVVAVIIDPLESNTIYAATDGFMYKSTNGGNNWNPLNPGWPASNIYIDNIAINHMNSDIIYAGGSWGQVYKSTDGGANWSSVYISPPGFPGLHPDVRTVAIDPLNPDTIYAVTDQGVFKSIDGGTNWNVMNNGLTGVDVQSLAIDPINSNNIYAGTYNGGVFKSIDGGTNWSFVGLKNLYRISFVIDPVNPDIVYAWSSISWDGIFKSTDGGNNWNPINTGPTAIYPRTLAIDPFNPNVIYAGAYGGVFRSADGGANWRAMNNGLANTDVLTLAIDPISPNVLYAGTNGGLSKISQSIFNDVITNHWAFNQIKAIFAAGITGGCSSDPPLFCPDDPITRGQMAVFLAASLGYSSGSCRKRFSDVPVGNPFCGFIERLYLDGITEGCGSRSFCPDEPITRGQMAVFVETALGNPPDPCTGQFADVPISHPFCGFIERLAADGITGGCGGGNFCPNDPVTRAQMAVFLVAAPDPLKP